MKHIDSVNIQACRAYETLMGQRWVNMECQWDHNTVAWETCPRGRQILSVSRMAEGMENLIMPFCSRWISHLSWASVARHNTAWHVTAQYITFSEKKLNLFINILGVVPHCSSQDCLQRHCKLVLLGIETASKPGHLYRHPLCLSIDYIITISLTYNENYKLFSLLSLIWKNKVGLWDHVPLCVCIHHY
jgi:hypothetical protein